MKQECLPKMGEGYSTSEVNTGLKWIDGKPLYRKTITQQLTLNDEAKEAVYNHGISNVDKIMLDSSASYIQFSDGTTCGVLPFINVNSFPNAISVTSVTAIGFAVATGTDRSHLTLVLTFQYTKTTN